MGRGQNFSSTYGKGKETEPNSPIENTFHTTSRSKRIIPTNSLLLPVCETFFSLQKNFMKEENKYAARVESQKIVILKCVDSSQDIGRPYSLQMKKYFVVKRLQSHKTCIQGSKASPYLDKTHHSRVISPQVSVGCIEPQTEDETTSFQIPIEPVKEGSWKFENKDAFIWYFMNYLHPHIETLKKVCHIVAFPIALILLNNKLNLSCHEYFQTYSSPNDAVVSIMLDYFQNLYHFGDVRREITKTDSNK
ncbi:hypothetical protein EGR_07773 [Echinococcus granulosus]|uniref:Uncharacterized protein n=1 Tax=Echinococcus granulosus TaxID=6210 RepID=W6U890_ECHGR|nr:hypothetical protein EGR_07773 [Echinococcus granulosus]EUB57380.1 hypothetical protein EGR_07773 [Echinococcus granulosus]